MLSKSPIPEFIEASPEASKPKLKELYKLLQKELPQAEEKIAYGIPTFKMKKNIIHFAGYEKHIGLYPGSKAIEHFKSQLSDYPTSKGTIQLPLDKALPSKLISEIVAYQLQLLDLTK